MNPFRRDRSRRLPGSLCDEGPGATAKPIPSPWQPREDLQAETVTVRLGKTEADGVGTAALAELRKNYRQLEDDYLKLAEKYRQVRADRDVLSAANGTFVDRLTAARQRIEGLELTVASLRGLKPLRVQDDELLIRPLPAAPNN